MENEKRTDEVKNDEVKGGEAKSGSKRPPERRYAEPGPEPEGTQPKLRTWGFAVGAVVLLAVLTLVLCAMAGVFDFGGGGETETEPPVVQTEAPEAGTPVPDTTEPPVTETPEPEETRVAGNEYVTIDGICVDDSYRDDEDSPIRMVYLFYTVTAGEENLKVDSIYTDLTINDGTFDIISGGGAENGPEHTADMGMGGGMGGGRRFFGTETADGQTFTPPDGTDFTDRQPPEMTIDESGDGSFDPSTWFDPDDFDDASTEDTEDTVSTKGLKANNAITVNGGEFSVDSADDTIHSNYSIEINNGSFQLSSGDDGVHADAYLTVNGGTIDISESYEGLEAAQIAVNGGTTTLTASDDGLNAAGGADFEMTEDGLVLKTTETTDSTDAASGDTDQGFGRGGMGGMMDEENCDIYINGGTLIVNADGDGLDSNGNLTVTGGTIIVFGPTSGADGALDYGGEGTISGGTIAAFGSIGMAQGLDSSGEQSVLMVSWDETQQAQTRISLCDENGQILFSILPEKEFQSAVISTAGMTSGQTMGLYTGGTTNSDSQIITMGELTDATKLCDVTLADEMTSISSDGSERAQMGMGGMGGGKGNRGDVTPPDGATPPERPANDGTAPEGTPSGGTSADS